MKTAKITAALFVALIAVFNPAVAAPSLEFPDQKIGMPATSLAEAVRENPPSFFRSSLPPADFRRTTTSPVPKFRGNKFVFKPNEGVDYKLLIKTPDPSVDYRMIVKNPDDAQKK